MILSAYFGGYSNSTYIHGYFVLNQLMLHCWGYLCSDSWNGSCGSSVYGEGAAMYVSHWYSSNRAAIVLSTHLGTPPNMPHGWVRDVGVVSPHPWSILWWWGMGVLYGVNLMCLPLSPLHVEVLGRPPPGASHHKGED